ncbi:MAG: hypothetical protein GY864_02680 [Desulfobacterales bacterium]|nr:hypothetical protein [Desulfobacterales bacterium]
MTTQSVRVERRKHIRFKVKKELAERRKHQRFKAKETTYILLKPQSTRMGQIVDINKNGIAFLYINIGTQSEEFLNSFELSLFLSEGILYLSIPIQTMSHFEMADRFPHSSVKMKRSYVKFGKMTQQERSQLTFFLENHTNGFLEDRRDITL